ncbi:DUF1365 domain-containing protein [Vibrio sonorensis]|uniref:DUF1365 domain-containing protein n=1 Tax=Vibrio sonorensis TaxID=1004316 RepID=UPI0008DA14DF|nr:DUF1365 family protein [Vibrio sonorensis]
MTGRDLNSAILSGNVRHRRFAPTTHSLNYHLFMPSIDLDELETLEKQVVGFGQKWWNWARFRRQDYLGEGCLKQAIQDKVFELTGKRFDGRVEAVVHLRYLGFYFSPVNFYYLFDQEGEWQYLLAEVSNTPWNQRHYYAIPKTRDGKWQHEKAFHVSPFNPIEQNYHWRLKRHQSSVLIHLECHRSEKEFDATMTMKKEPLSSKNLIGHLIKTPVMAVKVIIGIYWHALKLWLKKTPFYAHPDSDNNNEHREQNTP